MKKSWPLFILILISAALVIYFYGKPLTDPNDYLFSDSDDGLKNYYTYYYHIAHDTSATTYSGMNYPYGEHYLYTDCHPIIANTIRMFGGDGTYSIGLINLMMILSVFFTFMLMYFIMRNLGIKSWIALLFSIGIGLLAPQIFRMNGHLALSYSVAIPLSWLLIIRIFKARQKYIPLIFLFLFNIFWLFIHAYLGMICIAFQLAFWVVLIVLRRKAWKPMIHLSFVLSFLLPMILFQTYINQTDTHIGRTDNPSGFFLYNAEPDDLFLPHHPPLKPLFDQINGLHIDQEWEGWAYIGIAFTIMLLVFVVTGIGALFRKRSKEIFLKFTDNALMNYSLLAACLVLLFAFAFPFKMFPALADLLPYIKQFRATGRFAWVFFFVASVYGVYLLQIIFKRLQHKPILAYTIIILSGGMTIAEGLPYHSETSEKVCQNQNILLLENADSAYKQGISIIDISEYQAILPLPFFYYGSEAYARPLQPRVVKQSMLFSAYTGLPQLSTYLTRTSVPESKNIVQLMSPPWYPKEIAKDLTDQRDFLIITSGEAISSYEKMLLSRSEQLFTSENLSLYKISKEALLANNAEQMINDFISMQDDLYEQEEFLTSDSAAWFYFDSFDKQNTDTSFRGTAAYSGMKQGKNTFAALAPHTFSSGKTYIVSAWMYNDNKDALNLWFRFMVEEYDVKQDSWYISTMLPEQSEVIYGNWSLIELKFTVQNGANEVAIVSKGKDNSKAALYLDELLIREEGTDVYRFQEDALFLNNHEIINK